MSGTNPSGGTGSGACKRVFAGQLPTVGTAMLDPARRRPRPTRDDCRVEAHRYRGRPIACGSGRPRMFRRSVPYFWPWPLSISPSRPTARAMFLRSASSCPIPPPAARSCRVAARRGARRACSAARAAPGRPRGVVEHSSRCRSARKLIERAIESARPCGVSGSE